VVIQVPLPNESDDEGSRFGFDQNRSYLSAALGWLVPQWLARRAIAVSVETDRPQYRQGDTVEMTIEFKNRLPVPVEIETPRRRLWGWSVDGELEATDERVYTPGHPGLFSFRPREHKTVHREWAGRFKRTDGDTTRWVTPKPKEYEIEAFVAVDGSRPSDSTTIEIT